MQEGIKGVFHGVAPVSANATIIVTNFERQKHENNHIYHLKEFLDETTKVVYRENDQEKDWNFCPGCLGAGNQTMMARVLYSMVQSGETYFNFIPLRID